MYIAMLRRLITRRIHNSAISALELTGITIIREKEQAFRALEELFKHKDRVHAWDTETINLEVKEQSPVGNGQIICASAFIGPEVDFGSGSKLFIDNFSDAEGILDLFKEYFEDPSIFKVWHNYGFDRHVLFNHNINVQGFGGDTMHMARLANPSRGSGEYSLSKCSKHYSQLISKVKANLLDKLKNHFCDNHKVLASLKEYEKTSKTTIKQTMEELFSYKKQLKSGGISKLSVMPDVLELHTNPNYTEKWVEYSCLDAELTFYLREALVTELAALPLKCEDLNDLWEFYMKYWIPLGETLTDMERSGMQLDVDHFAKIKLQAENDKFRHMNEFMAWVGSISPDLHLFNPNSTAHMQQLLFAPFHKTIEDSGSDSTDSEKKTMNLSLKDQGFFPKERTFLVENTNRRVGEKRMQELLIKGLGIPIVARTSTGMPSVDSNVLKQLAGSRSKYGSVYEHFKSIDQEEFGVGCCEALLSLLEYKSIDTLLNNFIMPLQTLCDKDGRIHYSLNINTETGRLSAKRPNAQNQPALDKDKYFIRKGFVASPGNCLVIADYGQLELRILAHMTNCKSMISAFEAGGDFHSRTAISMYSEIQEAVNSGTVLLEGDPTKDVPLLKNVYAAQRKTAKTMNFSIAYGKTAHGFATDWGCSYEEAQEALMRWYSDRKEVLEWQEQVKTIAVQKGFTRTLLGRYRRLTALVRNPSRSKKQHGLRAAINTPIQGGAADIVNSAMVRINYSKELKDLGWKLLLQVHDEVILEGPQESSRRALEIVKEIMEDPLDELLRIKLETDAKIAKNWYEGK